MALSLNALEKLLLYNCWPSRASEVEAGLKFRVSTAHGETAISLLYRIDQPNGIAKKGSIRPDYLSVWIDAEQFIITIIELKNGHLNEAVNQIIALKNIIGLQLNETLPGLKPTIQGIIVCAPNIKYPTKEIQQAAREKLSIAIVPVPKVAELVSFVNKPLSKDKKPGDALKSMRIGAESFNLLEQILIKGFLKHRDQCSLKNKFCLAHRGLYLDFEHPTTNERGILACVHKNYIIAVDKLDSGLHENIRKRLVSLGYSGLFSFQKKY